MNKLIIVLCTQIRLVAYEVQQHVMLYALYERYIYIHMWRSKLYIVTDGFVKRVRLNCLIQYQRLLLNGDE